MSAKEYRKRLEELGLLRKGGVELSASSVPEAKQALLHIKQLQLELRNIKRELSLEMKVIRQQYQQQMPSAGSGASSVLTLFGKRKAAGSIRADAKRHVAADRDRALSDYEAVKQTVDGLLVQMESAKLSFQQFIEQHK